MNDREKAIAAGGIMLVVVRRAITYRYINNTTVAKIDDDDLSILKCFLFL